MHTLPLSSCRLHFRQEKKHSARSSRCSARRSTVLQPLDNMRVALLSLLLTTWGESESARILAAVPFPAISHQLPFRLIALELAKRGHHVTFITTDPIKETIANYTEIDVSASYKFLRTSFDWVAMTEWSPVDMILKRESTGARICEEELQVPEMKNFIKSARRFDLLILERLHTPCFYGLAHVVGSPPIIGFVSVAALPQFHSVHGNPSNPAYIPEMLLAYSDHMSFWQRLCNTYIWIRLHHSWFNVVLPKHEEIQRKYFGSDVPSVFDVERNFSLMLITNHFSVNYPRPNLPNMIELTGLHVDPSPKTLSKANTMPEPQRRAFLDAFAQLPQRVLWKWEVDNTTDLPANVKMSKWLPQQAILAHPNVLLFVTQGGLQSFNEAVYHGVPLVGIPFFGDQQFNVAKMVTAGIGYKLKFQDISTATVMSAIRTVIDDKSYRENMKQLSAVYREHQAESLPRAVWWIEYVLRHNGAPHLRSAALDLSWYQLLLLDVVAFVLAVAVASGAVLFALARSLISIMSKDKKIKKH